jgi:cytochrome c-type protein NapC
MLNNFLRFLKSPSSAALWFILAIGFAGGVISGAVLIPH